MRTLLASLALLLGGCAVERELTPGTPPGECASWKGEVGPAFAERCASCHGAGKTEAGYNATQYLSAIGRVGPRSEATPGDASSPLVQTLDPSSADAVHAPVSDVFPLVRSWVVDCGLRYTATRIHPAGVMDPASDGFHGNLLRSANYQYTTCERCHGEDLRGGVVGASCLTCHAQGPKACDTCHQLPPQSGAHAVHANPPLGAKPVACEECHVVPHAVEDPGHVVTATGELDPSPAEVSLGGLAGANPSPARRRAEPTYEPSTRTCSNVYCHGGAFADAKAERPNPSWTDELPVPTCTGCHGTPPEDHAAFPALGCVVCHSASAGPNGIAHPALHIDGVVQVADVKSCSGCHGSAASPAPPPDLRGNTDPTAIGVGTHQSHLQATHRLTAPVPCSACHVVPTDVNSPGHLDPDLQAEVFPATPGWTSLATAGGSTPTWNHAAATCTNTYCHTGGQVLSKDTTPNLLRAPVWTKANAGQAACGTSCHGVPPKTPVHSQVRALSECVNCHAKTVDAFGRIVITGGPGAEVSTHINGVIDGR